MKSRNPLNSKVLKHRFPKIYREFFSKCQIVVSVPHFFTWAGEYAGYWGGMMLLQKIPLRVYIGLETSPSAKKQGLITIETDAKSFSILENKFKPDQYEYLAEQRLLKFLNSRFCLLKQKAQHFKLHILSELPLGSTGSIGALSSALAVLLSLRNYNISQEQIKNWSYCRSRDLIKKNNLKFNSVFRLAWKICTAYHGNYTSGATVFNVLLPSDLPCFYCIPNSKNIKLALNVGAKYKSLDKIQVWGGRIKELFKLKQVPSWPIDFALISLGEPRGITSFSTQELQEAMQKTNKFAKRKFKEFFKPNKKHNTWQSALKVINFLSLQTLINLGQLLKAGHRHDLLREFLQTLDKHQIPFLLLGLTSSKIDMTKAIIHQEACQIDDLGAGVKSVSTTNKGVILFALPHGRIQPIIQKIINRVKIELGLDLNIMHASWLDGTEKQGVKIEQYLEQKIYSDFVSKNTFFVKEFDKTGKSAIMLLTPEEFKNKSKKIDLLIDDVKSKIYVMGKVLASKEIHSASASIKILKILLQNLNKEITNHSLPESSYSRDYYELRGKIASPLIKAIEKRTKKKLAFQVKGSVTDFSLKLNLEHMKVWLVLKQEFV